MEIQQEDIFNYKLPVVPDEMVDLAKAFYAMAEGNFFSPSFFTWSHFFSVDGSCYSFPWIAWEGLDKWWTTDDTRTPRDNIVKRLESESLLYRLGQRNLPNISSVQKLKVEFLRFPWFQEFTNIVFCWIQAENFDHFTLGRALTFFMKKFIEDVCYLFNYINVFSLSFRMKNVH